LSELGEFNGSVSVNKTLCEISAKYDFERTNFLSLNIVNNVVTGKKNSLYGQEFYTNAFKEFVLNKFKLWTKGKKLGKK
jgi:hypothetical protein